MTLYINDGLHPEDTHGCRKISDWLVIQIKKLKDYHNSQKRNSGPYVPVIADFMERGAGMVRWGFKPDNSVDFIRFGPELWLLRNPETKTYAKIWMGGLPGSAVDEVPSNVEAIRNWFDGHKDDWSPIPSKLLSNLDLYDPEIVMETATYPEFTQHTDRHRGSRAPLELRLAFRVIYWLPSLIKMMQELLEVAEAVVEQAQFRMKRISKQTSKETALG